MTRKQTALITFMRHGQKDAQGALTAAGLDQARQFGLQTSGLDGDMLLFHSGVGRVRDTIRTAAAYLGISGAESKEYQLGEHMVDYVAPNLHFLVNGDVRGDYTAEWNDASESPERVSQRMRAFLEYDWRSPDPGIWYSPRQMAQNIAQMIGIQVRFANMTETKHVINIVNGSHEPVLTSFLCYFLQNYDFRSAACIDEIGGSIRYAEGFTINVYHNSIRDFDVELRFRDKTLPFDLERARAFAYST